jgi:hypothetical protein
MVAHNIPGDGGDESSVHLLYNHRSRSHSDLDDFLNHSSVAYAPPEKPKLYHRTTLLQRLKRKLQRSQCKPTRGTPSDDSTPDTADVSIDKELSDTACTNDAVFEVRDGPPPDSRPDTISTVSSLLTSSTTARRKRTLLAQWKTRMNKSIRKLLRTENKEPVDPGLYVYAPEDLYAISRQRYESAFIDLQVPSLHDANGILGEVPARGGYSTESADFPLESGDSILLEQIEVDRQGLVRSLSISSGMVPQDSFVSVAFDHDCAQLVFMPTTSFVNDDDEDSEDDEFDLEAYHTDAQSKVSEDDNETYNYETFLGPSETQSADEWDDDDETEFSDTERKPLGAAFSHPSSRLYQVQSEESEDQPLGIACPPWSTQLLTTQNDRDAEEEVWSQIEDPPIADDGEITEPPSPTVVERKSHWCGLGQSLGWSGSDDESDITMSAFTCNDIPRLPKFPTWKCPGEDHPFDEVDDDSDSEGDGEECAPKSSFRKPVCSTTLSQKFENLVLSTLGHKEVNLDEYAKNDYGSRYSASNVRQRIAPRCHCVKCAAKSIYEDLIHGGGVSPDRGYTM